MEVVLKLSHVKIETKRKFAGCRHALHDGPILFPRHFLLRLGVRRRRGGRILEPIPVLINEEARLCRHVPELFGKIERSTNSRESAAARSSNHRLGRKRTDAITRTNPR